MSIDATPRLREAVLQQARAQNFDEAHMAKLKASHILRALSRKSVFLAAAADIAKTIQAVGDLCKRHRRDFLLPNTCTEAERDRIEAEIGQYIRTCTGNISRLEDGVPHDFSGKDRGCNASTAAHCHGVCLILSERLQHIGKAFDQCRAVRYQHLIRKRNAAKEAQVAAERADRQHHESQASRHQGIDQTQMISDAENAALQRQLLNTSSDVARLERGMRDVATLNQMFSTQVVQQSEQIEHIYAQAVQTSMNVAKGNQQLQKALTHSAAARKYVFILLLLASCTLLFFDWFYSARRNT